MKFWAATRPVRVVAAKRSVEYNMADRDGRVYLRCLCIVAQVSRMTEQKEQEGSRMCSLSSEDDLKVVNSKMQ